MIDLPKPGRRHLLAMLTALPAPMRAGNRWLRRPPPSHRRCGRAVRRKAPGCWWRGPSDGTLNRWADALLPALEQSLPADTSIHRIEIGSADGVTGANQFEARGAPDGLTVLLAPGQAALAWMVGDPRVQFDVGHWVPVMAGMSTGIVVGRPRCWRETVTPASPPPDRPALDLAALLGIHLLGAQMSIRVRSRRSDPRAGRLFRRRCGRCGAAARCRRARAVRGTGLGRRAAAVHAWRDR